jgi:hypothetical protein
MRYCNFPENRFARGKSASSVATLDGEPQEQKLENSKEMLPESQTQTRRGFGYAVIYGLGALIGAALALPAALYLLLPPKTRKQDAWVEAGDLSQLQPGTPQEMTFRRMHTDGWKIQRERNRVGGEDCKR